MNKALWGGLVAVLGLTLYLQVQGDDAELLADRPQTATRPRAETAPTPTRDAPRASPAPGVWADAALVRAVRQWQLRMAAAPRSAEPARPTAWRAAVPQAAVRPVLAPAQAVEAQAPVAPRFPHQWVGRFNDGAVLAGAERTWVAQAGDDIEGQWRVDRMDGVRLSLTYLPLNQSQQIVMR